jgi:hypothetical protein
VERAWASIVTAVSSTVEDGDGDGDGRTTCGSPRSFEAGTDEREELGEGAAELERDGEQRSQGRRTLRGLRGE